MNIKRYFYNIFLSIYNQKKDSFFLLIIFMVMTIIIFIFYGFSISSKMITNRIDDNANVNITFKAHIRDDLDEATYKNSIATWLEANDELLNHNYRSTLVINTEGNLDGKTINIYSFDEKFYEEGNKLIEGAQIPQDNGVLIAENTIIHNELLNIGDDIVLTNNDGRIIELNVSGIYSKDNTVNLLEDSLYQSDDYQIIMDEKTLLDFISKNDELIIGDIMVEFKGIDNSEEISDIINDSLGSFMTQGNTYEMEIDDELAQKLKLPIHNASNLYGLMATVFFIALTILLIFVLVYCVKNRIKEYGIWMAMGLSKKSLLIKFFMEISILMSISYIICLPLSKIIFRQINNLMIEQNGYTQAQILHLYDTEGNMQILESDEYLVEIETEDYIKIYGFLLIICLSSSLISFISLFNKKVIEFVK